MGKYTINRVPVCLGIGQSNEVASALSSGATYPNTNANIFILWKSLIPNPASNTDDRNLAQLNAGVWQSISAGVNSGSPKDVQDGVSRVGPEFALGQLIFQNKGLQLHRIPAARGGTSLNNHHDPAGFADPESMYTLAVELFKEGIDRMAYKGVPVVFASWHQGESDSTGPGPAAVYEANLGDYFTNLRAEHPLLTNMVVFLWRITTTDTTTYPEKNTVRAAQVSYADGEDLIVFGNVDGQPHQDLTHLNAVGQEFKGTVMYNWLNTYNYIEGNV